jgi:hypothetical protein
MKIFIAGATGVVGRRRIPVLTQIGHQVAADFLEKKVIWSFGSCTRRQRVRRPNRK